MEPEKKSEKMVDEDEEEVKELTEGEKIVEDAKTLTLSGKLKESNELLKKSVEIFKAKKDFNSVVEMYLGLVNNAMFDEVPDTELAESHAKELLEYLHSLIPLPPQKHFVNVYIMLAEIKEGDGELDESEKYYRKGLDLCLKEGTPADVENTMCCFSGLAEVYEVQSKFKQSEDIHNAALKFAQERNLKEEEARVIFEMANLYEEMVDDDGKLATEYYIKSLNLWKTQQDQLGQLEALSQLASLYECRESENEEEEAQFRKKAITYLLEADGLVDTLSDEWDIKKCAVYNGLGYLFLEEKDYERSMAYFQKEMNIVQTHPEEIESQLECLNNFALISDQKKEYSKSNDYHKQALTLSEKIDEEGERTQTRAFIFTAMGGNYVKMSDFQNALQVFQEALKLQESCEDVMGIGFCNKDIGECFMKLNDHEKALFHLNKALGSFASVPTAADFSDVVKEIKELIDQCENITGKKRKRKDVEQEKQQQQQEEEDEDEDYKQPDPKKPKLE